MAKQLAIEWDDNEIRVLAARSRGNRFAVTDVLTIDISGAPPEAVGVQLRDALTERGLLKLPALIAIGRGRAELRQLNLPAIPDAELPDVVRFQAVRQFAAAGERAAIDFLPISRSDTAVEVAAAALAPEHLEAIRHICAPSELQLQRIVLRPTAAAALFQLAKQSDSRETILIDTLADEVDLIVMRGNTPAFLRSVRVPSAEAARIRTIVNEVRRSLMAVRRDGSNSSERRIIVWGRAEAQIGLNAALTETLGIESQSVNPFDLVETPPEVLGELPEHVGRFAPLLGLLEGDILKGEGLIDFLNPRRTPEPQSNRDRYLLYGGFAAAVLLLLGWMGWSQLRQLDLKYQKTLAASNDLVDEVEAAQVSKANLARLDQFLDGDVFMLGELAYLSENLASAEQMQISQLTASIDPRGGASLAIRGVAQEPSTVIRMESKLRNASHQVTGDGVKSDPRGETFKFQFSNTVRIPADSIRQQRLAPAIASPPAEEQLVEASTDDAAASERGAEVLDEVEIEEPAAPRAGEPRSETTGEPTAAAKEPETTEEPSSEVGA